MKRSIKKIVFTVITFSLTCLMLSSCGARYGKIAAKIEDSIEKGDFNKAKQLNKKRNLFYYETRLTSVKICKAQVSSLIDEGQFNLAADIAKEDADYGVYYENLIGKLVQLYECNSKDLTMALTSIQFPKKSECSYWNGKYVYWNGYRMNQLYEAYNNNIRQLLLYAKTKNDVNFVQTVAAFLRPLYKIVNSGYYEDYEDTPTDYIQVNQIKKELGIK